MNTHIKVAANECPFPHRSISPSDLQVLLDESEIAAARIARRFRLPACERDDLRQDILVDLLSRISAFDPTRGTFGAFVGAIAGHRATRLSKRIRRRSAASSMISLDEAIADAEAITQGNTVAEPCGISASLRQTFDRFAEIERRLDLIRAFRGLLPHELSLCAKLAEYTATEISRSGEYSRASLYRRLRKIRLRLVAEGFSCP